MEFLEIQPEVEPIELCHFECIDEEVIEDADKSYSVEYDKVYLGHIFRCFTLTGNENVLSLMANLGISVTKDEVAAFDEFSTIDAVGYSWCNLEAWEELGYIYLEAGYPVYLSDEYFDVYSK